MGNHKSKDFDHSFTLWTAQRSELISNIHEIVV